MKIIVFSDVHDHLENLRKLFEREKDFDLGIFCGDFVSPFTAREMAKYGKKIIGVWGNNEGDRPSILKNIQGSKIEIGYPREIDLFGEKSFIFHNFGSIDQTIEFSKYLLSKYRFIFFGHTHRYSLFLTKESKVINYTKELEKKAIEINIHDFKSMAINPGELCGWLTGAPTYIKITLKGERIRIELKKL